MKGYFVFFFVIVSRYTYAQNTTAESDYTRLINEGFVLIQQHDFYKSIEKYKEALRVKENGVEALYGAGIGYTALCIQQGDSCNMAIQYLQEVEKLAPGYRFTFPNLASCFIRAGNYEKAIYYAEKTLAQDAQDGEGYYHRGFARMQTGKSKEGCEDLRQSAKLGYKDAEPLLQQLCK